MTQYLRRSEPVQSLTAKEVLKIMTLPRILPRFKELFGTGFAHFAFFMALVYRSVRLLPQGHPYLAPANIGRFGTLNVIGEAANHLVFRRENADQVIIFFSIIAAMILLCLQLFSLLVTTFFPDALAAVSFTTPSPKTDIAFMLLDRVFGVPGVFDSCVASNNCIELGHDQKNAGAMPMPVGAFPWPFHRALHTLFQFYSMALLVVASIILAYYSFAVLAETAQSGKPFGNRFNTLWAPLRIVVAFGLLIPLANGLNGAQYITLYAAKLGSGLATNGWLQFNKTLNDTYFAGDEMVAKPSSPKIASLVRFVTLARACVIERQMLLENGRGAFPNQNLGNGYQHKPYIVKGFGGVGSSQAMPANAGAAYTFYGNGPKNPTATIEVVYGHYDATMYPDQVGNVNPTCGILVLPPVIGQDKYKGAEYIRDQYYQTVYDMWSDGAIHDLAVCFVENNYTGIGALNANNKPYDQQAPACPKGSEDYQNRIKSLVNKYNNQIKNDIKTGVDIERGLVAANAGKTTADLKARGWAGAGIYYNRVAELNGAILGAAWAVPNAKSMPAVMELTYNLRIKNDQNVTPENQYDPNIAAGQGKLDYASGEKDKKLGAQAANAAPAYAAIWKAFLQAADSEGASKQSGNVFIDMIAWVLGADAIFQMRDPDNARLHPLAQLSALGKGLVDATIRNVVIAAALTAGGSLPKASMLGVLGSFMFTVIALTLTAGFVLYYVVPFLPFIYFFFAVGAWIKAIFEAMVGVPLWALAHIRIEGDGLPGQSAMGGYFLIFEIFVRPLMIVFGMIASISIFAALVAVLNDMFDLAIANLSGRSADAGLIAAVRGPIDQLFFTILYVIIVYMIGMSCFKLVDEIPRSILRWMGAGVNAFQDQNPAEGLVGQASQVSGIVNTQVIGQVGSLAGRVGGMATGILRGG